MPELTSLRGSRSLPWRSSNVQLNNGRVVYGTDPAGVATAVQIVVAQVGVQPTRGLLTEVLRERAGRRPVQVIVALEYDSRVWLFGPEETGDVAGPISVGSAARQLQAVLAEPSLSAAVARWRSLRQALANGSSGVVNRGMFATHYLEHHLRTSRLWKHHADDAAPLMGLRGRKLIDGLGFAADSAAQGTLLLSVKGQRKPRATAVLLDRDEQFDAQSSKHQVSPVAFGLRVAAREDVPWLVAIRGDTIRLYSSSPSAGVSQNGQADTFFELDLSVISGEDSPLLPLVFSAAALDAGGSVEQILENSTRFAADLGTRLRDRIYADVVPTLAVAVANQLHRRGSITLDAEGLQHAYEVTLRLLFRLLFQAYAEDRGLLPAGRNTNYDHNSLKNLAQQLQDASPEQFGQASSLWRDLAQVWDAIDQGNPLWNVPAYNGGLFSSDPARSPDGALIASIPLPDAAFGPALQALLIDETPDDVRGPVDFSSLSVREFGTIYEGLLESSLSVAETDLVLDKNQAWTPAKPGTPAEQIEVRRGEIYFHSASGERKATGSYFTPKLVVDYLVKRSVTPALSDHLQRVTELLDANRDADAADLFFDFRVADLAVGSGHFLVTAVDAIEAGMRAFLTEHALPAVTEELQRLAAAAERALGDDETAKQEIEPIRLLRRQIARRCIYGVDINPMAVELARLALWIHTFVPGLPMSTLDHNLVCANSLTGIGTIGEALDVLIPHRKPTDRSLFDDAIEHSLEEAGGLLREVAKASEADKAEVQQGTELLRRAEVSAAPAKAIFDVAVAARIGRVDAHNFYTVDDITAAATLPEVREAVTSLHPAHMPYLFPEVFQRDRAGFDVLLGNPPWEKAKIERDQWWGLHIPGLRGMRQQQKNATLDAFIAARPDLNRQYEQAVADTLAFRSTLIKGPYPGLGKGDPDLYQAFAWRYWQLLGTQGRAGLVLPRGAHSGAAMAQWRKQVLEDGAFSDVCFLVNTNKWVFPSVDGRYTVGLTVMDKTATVHAARFRGPYGNAAEFAGAEAPAHVPADEFLTWTPQAAFPLIPDERAGEIFRTMNRQPKLGSRHQGWELRPATELHATGDKAVLQFDVEEARGRIPVDTGASFNLWNPDFGAPYAYADRDVLRPYLEKKLQHIQHNKRSAYYQMQFPDGALPLDQARIAFRDVTNRTNSRTMIACLLPPGTSATHKAPLFVRRSGTPRDEAALLGVLCSIPFDWYMRRWVETTMSFELVGNAPFPNLDENGLKSAIIDRAGRLAAVDDRYTTWAAEVGVPCGSVKTEEDRQRLIVELDALVSLGYGLSEGDVTHLFATFHKGWDYRPRLTQVLDAYRRFAKEAK